MNDSPSSTLNHSLNPLYPEQAAQLECLSQSSPLSKALDHISEKIAHLDQVVVPYKTESWTVLKT